MHFSHCLNELEEMFHQFEKQRLYHFDTGRGAPAPEGLAQAPGVYGIYQGKKLIYVGESENTRDRLWKHHRLGRERVSQLNRWLAQKMGKDTPEARQSYLRDSCQFRFLVCRDLGDLKTRRLLEAFLIAVLDPVLNRKDRKDRKGA
jgi:hypothetical protein